MKPERVPPGSHGHRHELSAADRATLLRKYRRLAIWRKRKDVAARNADATPTPPTARALQELSREFPGALRELDVLGLPEISRRITRLRRPPPPRTNHHVSRNTAAPTDDRWMAWILAYHGLMKAALSIKRMAGRKRHLSETGLHQAVAATRGTGVISIDVALARAILRPPGGRLTVVVLTALANHFQESATEISRTLFPPRRPPPYVLSS